MLLYCSECPTALCHDCFPPDFRRVRPPEKFWADLHARNWNVSSQTMVLFRCNSCRASAEANIRQKMDQEELEAQQDEKKHQALEERRNLAASKSREEDEDARRRMR